jgi:hypothetical protein
MDGFPADSGVTIEQGHTYSAAGTLDEFGRLFRCEGLIPPFVFTANVSTASSAGFQRLPSRVAHARPIRTQ